LKYGTLGGFATPATTHDNCTGEYPICFFIWDLAIKNTFPEKVPCDIYNKNAVFEGVKIFHSIEYKSIIDWLREYYDKTGEEIAYLRIIGTDVQNNSGIYITSKPAINDVKKKMIQTITKNNLIEMCIYFAARKVIPAIWINDNDQYFYPKKEWENDTELHNDCIAFTLFNSYNKIKIREGTNHWIPYAENDIGCKTQFESRFMSSFIKDKIFSTEAQSVLDAGKELYRYYHLKAKTDKSANINASFYDIREYFQGRNERGLMKTRSTDNKYNELIGILRDRLKVLAKKIEPKVYEYGFLLE
jgi:hypothetical protein